MKKRGSVRVEIIIENGAAQLNHEQAVEWDDDYSDLEALIDVVVEDAKDEARRYVDAVMRFQKRMRGVAV
jgi:hypothetical protein